MMCNRFDNFSTACTNAILTALAFVAAISVQLRDGTAAREANLISGVALNYPNCTNLVTPVHNAWL